MNEGKFITNVISTHCWISHEAFATKKMKTDLKFDEALSLPINVIKAHSLNN